MQLAAQVVALYEAKDERARSDTTATGEYQDAVATLRSLAPFAELEPAGAGTVAPTPTTPATVDLTGNLGDVDEEETEGFDLASVLGMEADTSSRPQPKRPKYEEPVASVASAIVATGTGTPSAQRRVDFAPASVTPHGGQAHGLRVCYPRNAPCGYITCEWCNGGPDGSTTVKVCTAYEPCGYVTCRMCGNTKPTAR